MANYEEQLANVHELRRPAAETDRLIRWCVPQGPIGVSMTPAGEIEIFLAGPKLSARLPAVDRALEYQRWYRENGSPLQANRILLPSAGHYKEVAAFLCTELLRKGAIEDLARAFSEAEPLIEMAIDELEFADEAFLGLCGEVLLLNALVRSSPEARIAEVVESWKGFRPSARDFQLGSIGVEVKTTTRPTSSHRFSGVHQMEVGHGVDGASELCLYVVSLGLEWATPQEAGAAFNLPALVDEIGAYVAATDALSGEALVENLLAHISSYGGAGGPSYDHRRPAKRSRFSRSFNVRFARAYDMSDPGVRLLTTDDLRARPFIDPASVRLRVNLPEQLSGDLNPVVGLFNCAQHLLARSGL